MGVIKCVTPNRGVERSSEIPRLITMPTSDGTGKLGIIPLETYTAMIGGLQNGTGAPIDIPEVPPHPAPHNILWLVAKKQGIAVPSEKTK
ncbi:hypothetical protein JTB14_014509 [Gonioctena quinquepunctata]|nr:hypothetical protein JTB14_014509 [Gonioctena quinquepunctata]